MNPPESNDPLEAMLQEQNPYIDDGGFSARVVTALPRRRRTWLRPTFLVGVSAAGAALAARWLPWGDLPAFKMTDLLSAHLQPMLPWVLVLAVVGSLVWGVVTALEGQD